MLDQKDEIKARLDIVDVVSDYIQLKNAGAGSFKACCPFHAEKTPSFYVSKEKQIWHCFGCNKGGDFLSFIMEIEGIDFMQALEIAAKKAGVVLEKREVSVSAQEKDVMYDLNLIAQKLFAKILSEHEKAEEARNYIVRRGIGDNLVSKFGLGFAPQEWHMLTEFLQKRGYNNNLILNSGLAKKTTDGTKLIDRFRDRVMIPIYDASGRVVGFTGRALHEGEKSGPKYLNSPETLIYNKRAVLYGLHLAKQQVRLKKAIIIVEGNLDVVASHKAGVENVVASSGTALTQDQLLILKKLTNTLIFCFDGDNAGYEAAKRGIDLAQGMNFDVRVIYIPKELGKDPDDVVRNDPQAWVKLTQKPLHIMQYYYDKEFEAADMSDIESKKRVSAFLLSKISLCADVVEREHWLMHLSDRTRIDINELRSELKSSPSIAGSSAQEKQVLTDKNEKLSKTDKAVEMILGLCLVDSDKYSHYFEPVVNAEIAQENLKNIAKDAVMLYNNHKFIVNAPNTLFSTLRLQYSNAGNVILQDAIDTLVLKTELYLEDTNEKQVREEIDSNTQILLQIPQKQKLLEFERKIRQAEMSGEKDLAQRLSNEYALAIASLKHDN